MVKTPEVLEPYFFLQLPFDLVGTVFRLNREEVKTNTNGREALPRGWCCLTHTLHPEEPPTPKDPP